MYDVERSPVAKFFSQQVVFLTGATSGIGMMILYKILMCGPSKVFLLIRQKHGFSASDRFEKLRKADIFDSLPSEIFNQVLVVEGDITKPLLALSVRDLSALRSSTTVAINCAGLPKEIDSVSSQILHNVFGLEQFLQVCEGMENLKAVVTLSTCFAHVNRTRLEEKLYPLQQSLLVFCQVVGNIFLLWKSLFLENLRTFTELSRVLPNVLQLTQTLTRRAIHEPRSLDGRVDSLQETFQTAHNFSKQLSEHLLHFCQLPAVLVRTVHITGALRDPYPGWFQGSDPVLEIAEQISTRLTTGMTCESKNRCLMSPIDLVANTLLLCAYRRARIRERGCRVCHCSPEANAAVSWGDFIRRILEISQEKSAKPHDAAPWILLTPFHAITLFLFLFLDLACALTNDVIAVLHQELPRNTIEALRVHSNLHRLSVETRSKIVPAAENANLLLEDLSATDRELFGVNLNEIVWETYCDGLLKRNR